MKFYCKKCGFSDENPMSLTNGTCRFGGHHEIYSGHETGPYHCRKCGFSASDLITLTNGHCSSGERHEPYS